MRKEILVVLMLAMVSISCFAVRIYGSVFTDYRDEEADCGDIYVISSSGDTTITCVTDNGEYSVDVNNGYYNIFARVVRKDGTSEWYQSGVYPIDATSDDVEQVIDANASCLLRRVCSCGLKESEEE